MPANLRLLRLVFASCVAHVTTFKNLVKDQPFLWFILSQAELFTPFQPCNLLPKKPNKSTNFIKSHTKMYKNWICTVCSIFSGAQGRYIRGYLLLVRTGCLWGAVEQVHFACCSSLAWPHMLGLLLFIQNILRSLLASLPAKLSLSHGYRNCLRNCLALRLVRYYQTHCEGPSWAFIPEKSSSCPIHSK